MNFKQALEKAERITPERIERSLFEEIRKIEDFLISLNISQIENDEDSYSRPLENTNPKYSGFYQSSTAMLGAMAGALAPKIVGDRYNFLWTGDFFSGFAIDISNNTISLFSTGTGSGDKAEFFAGYRDIFGLTDESLREVIQEKLLPFFINFFRRELFGI